MPIVLGHRHSFMCMHLHFSELVYRATIELLYEHACRPLLTFDACTCTKVIVACCRENPCSCS